MSSIAGRFRIDGGKADAAVVRRMVEAMPHRSPEGQAVWSRGPVGLGHGMMHTTPESLHERLPFENAAGTRVITSDARIDNRAELSARLEIGLGSQPVTDSELILAAYEAWGTECLDALIGDFAFAIWDEAEQKLFCACDPFGIRPLFYHHAPGEQFAFSSEIKGLLRVPGVPHRIDEVCLGDYLVCNEADAEITLYEGIRRLPGAHALEVSLGGVRLWKHYELRPAQDVAGLTEAECVDRFRELFTEAVRCRMRSAFPVGSQLSGGLDSSAVTCVARDVNKGGAPLHTFSLIFDDVEGCDERPYIEAVVEQGGVVPHYIRGDAHGPLSNLPDLYEVLDDVIVGGAQRTIWDMLTAAREAGVRVLLDGFDGDSTVGHGNNHFFTLAQEGRWDVFAEEASKLASRFRETDMGHQFEIVAGSVTGTFNVYGLPVIHSQAARKQWVRFFRSLRGVHRYLGVDWKVLLRRFRRLLVVPQWLGEWQAPKDRSPHLMDVGREMVDEAFARRIGLDERVDRFRPATSEYHFEHHLGEREQQQKLLSSARRHVTMGTVNQVGAMFGIEQAHPFMDRRLIEFCLAAPPTLSLRDGWTRYIMRRALRHTLPEAVLLRLGKADMMQNYAEGLVNRDGAFFNEQLSDLGLIERYLDRDEVERYRRIVDEADPLQPSKERTHLARLVTLSILLEKRFGSRSCDKVKALG